MASSFNNLYDDQPQTMSSCELQPSAMAALSPPRVAVAAAATVSSPNFEDCHAIEDALADRQSKLVQILHAAEDKVKPIIVIETWIC
jgi:hypothetical protein